MPGPDRSVGSLRARPCASPGAHDRPAPDRAARAAADRLAAAALRRAPRRLPPRRRPTAHEETVLLARALDVLAADTTPRPVWPACSDSSPGPSAPAARRCRRRDRATRRGRRRPGRGSRRGGGARRLAGRQRRAPRAERAASGARPGLVHRRRRPTTTARRPPCDRPSTNAGPAPRRRHRALTTPMRARSRPPATSSSASSSPGEPTPIGSRIGCPPQLARHAAVALALVTAQLATERELAALRARGRERTTLRLDRRPRAADAADRPARLPRADPRRQGRRSRRRARLPGAQPRHRRLDGRARRRPAGAVPARVRDPRASRSGRSRSPRPAGQVAAGLLPIAIDRDIALRTALPPRLRAATRRSASGRADPDEPRRQRPEVHAARRHRRARRPRSTARSRCSSSATTAPGIAGEDRAGSSSASTAWPATSGSRARASACRSRATWPGAWAATSTSRRCRARAPRSSSSCPVRRRSHPAPSPRPSAGRVAPRKIGLEERAVLRALADGRTSRWVPAASLRPGPAAASDGRPRARPSCRASPPRRLRRPATARLDLGLPAGSVLIRPPRRVIHRLAADPADSWITPLTGLVRPP